MSSWYGEDLAWIHHTGHSDFAQSIAPWLIRMLVEDRQSCLSENRQDCLSSTLIVDIGCGSGVLARELTSAGFDVLGIDASPSMIALARETAPRARFEVGSFTTVNIPPCAAIVATGEVLNYGDLRAFIRRVRTNLLIFDIAERGSYPAHSEHRAGGDDWSVIAIKDSDGVHLTRRVLTFRNLGGEIRRSEEVHELELYNASDVKTLLREAGFSVQTRRSYGGYRLPKGHSAYIARRAVC